MIYFKFLFLSLLNRIQFFCSLAKRLHFNMHHHYLIWIKTNCTINQNQFTLVVDSLRVHPLSHCFLPIKMSNSNNFKVNSWCTYINRTFKRIRKMILLYGCFFHGMPSVRIGWLNVRRFLFETILSTVGLGFLEFSGTKECLPECRVRISEI